MKRNIIILLIQIFLVFTFISCEEADLADGDFCNDVDVETVCQNNRLFICENNEYNSNSCESVCAKMGAKSSGECRHDSEIDKDICWCETENTVCQETSISCVSDNEVKICYNDTWIDFTCSTEHCQQSGYSRFADSCSYSAQEGHDVCWCYE